MLSFVAGNSYALCASKNVNWLAARAGSDQGKPEVDQLSWSESELGEKTTGKRFGREWNG